MKSYFIFLLLFSGTCKAQDWMAEVMVGISGYNGDLTQRAFSFSRLRPAATLNIKFNSGDLINLRAGIGYGKVVADDKRNPDPGLKSRNLNFKSTILEFNICGEINLFDPAIHYSFPYIFGGLGVFHFDPFTHDNEGKKTYLQPLGTEGQGIEQYPDRKKYPLTQLCLPVGLGWKYVINEDMEVCYELGYRILFTDYLDDVSKTYVNPDVLSLINGPKAAELAYRRNVPFMEEGEVRGNEKVKDIYFFTGIKLAIRIGGSSY